MKIAAACCFVLSTMALAAEGSESAKGTFKSQGITMEVRSAVAYRGKSFLDKNSDALIVAITNARIRPEALSDYYDRHLAIEKHVKDEQTGVVYLEFRPDGSYRGLSYYFQSGNGCGYCTGEVTSHVRLVEGRLSGTLTDRESDRSFEITLDLPLLTDDHGATLGADGGAPGKAYLAYHDAIVKRDRAALKSLLSSEQLKTWADAEKKNLLGKFIDELAGEHPGKSARIVRGFATSNKAVLVIGGTGAVGKMLGEAILVKEKDGWRIDDEITDLAN